MLKIISPLIAIAAIPTVIVTAISIITSSNASATNIGSITTTSDNRIDHNGQAQQ